MKTINYQPLTINLQKGFTLIEIIVALGIFSVVAVVSLGALVKIIDANRKAQTLQAAMTNLNFALDAVSRELRVGSSYHCETTDQWTTGTNDSLASRSCAANQGQLIAFESSKVDNISVPHCRLIFVYRFENTGTNGSPRWQLEKAEKSLCGDIINPNNTGDVAYVSVISPNVTVADYRLGVSYDQNTQPFPRTFIRLVGYAGTREKERTYFDIQTTISARIP